MMTVPWDVRRRIRVRPWLRAVYVLLHSVNTRMTPPVTINHIYTVIRYAVWSTCTGTTLQHQNAKSMIYLYLYFLVYKMCK